MQFKVKKGYAYVDQQMRPFPPGTLVDVDPDHPSVKRQMYKLDPVRAMQTRNTKMDDITKKSVTAAVEDESARQTELVESTTQDEKTEKTAEHAEQIASTADSFLQALTNMAKSKKG